MNFRKSSWTCKIFITNKITKKIKVHSQKKIIKYNLYEENGRKLENSL